MHIKTMLCGTETEVRIMKKFIKEFCIRGLMFAWGGPFITAIVWFSIHATGKLETLTVTEAVLGIITTTVLAFIAAGISVIHQTENVPKAFAALIQAAVLYVDYLGFYLLNGWIPLERVWIFTVIFVAVFAIIWGIIYLSIKAKVDKMNRALHE